MKAGRHFDFFGFVIVRVPPNRCVTPPRFAAVGTRRDLPSLALIKLPSLANPAGGRAFFMNSIKVYLEIGKKRIFVGAVD